MSDCRRISVLAGLVVLGLGSLGEHASAQGTITNGAYTVGISATGQLFDPTSYTGFRRNSDGFDPLKPGNPYDSWGISANGSSAWAEWGSVNGVTSSLTLMGNSALFSGIALGLNVTMQYTFAAPNILKIHTVVTNPSPVTATNVLYQRSVDWDVFPTMFNENTVAPPIAGFSNVVDSSFNVFASADPLGFNYHNANAGANITADLAAGIRISLGNIPSGASSYFDYFYAISDGVSSPVFTAYFMQLLGSTYTMFTQSTENGNFPNMGVNYGALGVSAVSNVPAPAAATGLVSLVLLGWAARRHRRKHNSTSARTI